MCIYVYHICFSLLGKCEPSVCGTNNQVLHLNAVTSQIQPSAHDCDPASSDTYKESFEKDTMIKDVCGDAEALKHEAAKVYCSNSKG